MAAQSKGKRPKLVWAVFLYYILFDGIASFEVVLFFSGAIHLPQQQAALLLNPCLIDWIVSALGVFVEVAGAIAMFCLRKIAFHLFAAALAITIFREIPAVVFWAQGGAPVNVELISSLIHFCVAVAVCFYAWKLKKRGILV